MQKPWYSGYESDLIQAVEHFRAACERSLIPDKPFDVFKDEARREIAAQFIFESNNIEGEGLPEGDTKKLVLGEVEKKYGEYLDGIHGVQIDLLKRGEFNPKNPFSNLEIAVKYKGREKNFFAVLYHSSALADSEAASTRVFALKFDLLKNFGSDADESKKRIAPNGSLIARLQDAYRLSPAKEFYLKEELTKSLHTTLTRAGNNNDNGKPGEYRPSPAYINEKTFFLEPSLIPSAMKLFFKNHSERLSGGFYNPIIEACRLKEEFIKIHPFGDYNGRISRLIAGGFLRSEGYPFILILRSSATDKKKYFDAMKSVYRGNPSRLVSLVSQSIISQIRGLNTRLEISGLKTIQPIEMSKADKEKTLNELAEYEKNCTNMLL